MLNWKPTAPFYGTLYRKGYPWYRRYKCLPRHHNNAPVRCASSFLFSWLPVWTVSNPRRHDRACPALAQQSPQQLLQQLFSRRQRARNIQYIAGEGFTVLFTGATCDCRLEIDVWVLQSFVRASSVVANR